MSRRRRRDIGFGIVQFSFNLNWVGPGNSATPGFNTDLYMPVLDDTIKLSYFSDAGATIQVDTATSAPIDATAIANGTLPISVGPNPDGSYFAQAFHYRGLFLIGISNIVPFSISSGSTAVSFLTMAA
jgi:hypothetical protein